MFRIGWVAVAFFFAFNFHRARCHMVFVIAWIALLSSYFVNAHYWPSTHPQLYLYCLTYHNYISGGCYFIRNMDYTCEERKKAAAFVAVIAP
jgi:hypothetical protein